MLFPNAVKSPSVSAVSRRQTVLSGSVDGNGFPNALSAGAGLAVTLTATGVAFLLSFAAGFDSYGDVNYVSSFTTNQSFSGLTASTTNYLYVDRDLTTGILTTGFSPLIPVYSGVAPTSPATGQHWFDLSTFTMKRWNGSAWIVFQRVFVGEAVAGASAITSVVNYAYRGFYQSLWTAVAASTAYNFSHNLGLSLSCANPIVSVFSSIAGNDSDAMLANLTVTTVVSTTPNYFSYQNQNNAAGSRLIFRLITFPNVALNSSNTWVTSGYYKVNIARGW